jgi:NACalpha-BTF3-like transcription factor
MGKEEQIDSTKSKDEKKKDESGDKSMKDEKGQPLTEQDIALIKRYGKGPYNDAIKTVEADIK